MAGRCLSTAVSKNEVLFALDSMGWEFFCSDKEK